MLTATDTNIKTEVKLIYNDRNVNLKLEVFKPGEGELWHFHKIKDQVFYCLEGRLSIFTSVGNHMLSPGQSLFIKALTPHAVWNISKEETSFYLFSTTDELTDDKYVIDNEALNPSRLFYMLDAFIVEPLKECDLKEFSELISKNKQRLIDFPATLKARETNDISLELYREKGIIPYLIKHEAKIIGSISLKDIKSYCRSVELGYWIDRDYEGEGIFSKVLFGFINQIILRGYFRDINVRLDKSNHRNLNLLQRLQFRQIESKGLLHFHITGKEFIRLYNNIQFSEYKPEYKEAFRQMNIDWISKHFELENTDFQVLDYPEENILYNGGMVFFILMNGEVVSTGALTKTDNDYYELIKMATNPELRGLGLGNILLDKIIEWARCRSAKSIILYSQSSLFQALSLYRTYGFIDCPFEPGHYKRADVKMILKLDY